jgi:hypothetical protein
MYQVDNVNEEDETYESRTLTDSDFTPLAEALRTLDQFPNDSIVITYVP